MHDGLAVTTTEYAPFRSWVAGTACLKRQSMTRPGRPLGGSEFVRALERETKRLLALQKRGPKEKAHREERQGTLSFG
jgi:hypothetical protein